MRRGPMQAESVERWFPLRSRGAIGPHRPGVPGADQRQRRVRGVVDRIDGGARQAVGPAGCAGARDKQCVGSRNRSPLLNSQLPVRAARKSGSGDHVSENDNEPRLDWSTAQVADGRLTVALEGEPPKGWK